MDGHDGHGPEHGGHGGGLASLGAFGHSLDLGSMAASLGHSGHSSGSHSHAHHSHSVGCAPGPASGHSGWAFGFVGHALAQMGVMDAAATADISTVKNGVRLPGVVFGDNTAQVLVWPHGNIQTQHLFRRLATRHGLVSLSRKTIGVVASTKEHKSLLDTKIFDGPGKNSTASASFKGATGSTTVWTEFYQLPVAKHWWSNKEIDLGKPLPSHIVVTGYTWFFDQTGDYETRIAISVARPNTCIAGEWKPVGEDAVRKHWVVAQALALDIYDELKQAKPQPYSLMLRKLTGNCLPCASGPEESNTPADRNIGVGPGRVPHDLIVEEFKA